MNVSIELFEAHEGRSGHWTVWLVKPPEAEMFKQHDDGPFQFAAKMARMLGQKTVRVSVDASLETKAFVIA